MTPLNLVFMGSPDFALPSLKALHESPHTIRAVVSGSDKRRGRNQPPVPTPVRAYALEHGLPTIEADDVKSDAFRQQLAELDADLFVVVAFKILPEPVLKLPKKGSVNLHASLLPKYRGAAPIHHAIINGETETGCTVFFLEKEVDTGDVIGVAKEPIGPNDTTGDLYERLKLSGAELLLHCVNDIAAGRASAQPQRDEQSTAAPKLFAENTRISFHQPAQEVHNFIRGLSPFPGAWCTYNGKKATFYRSVVIQESDLAPGEPGISNGRLAIGCSTGAVGILEVQLPGTKRLSGTDFVNGFDLDGRFE
ncbi:MAG: methionyl-tRNA formyltransferase [Balneolaceae bacterium]